MNGSQGVQLIDYARAIRRRWPVVLIVAFLVLAAALVVSFSSEKQYDAQAELLFDSQDRVESLIGNDSFSTVDPEREITTGVQLIKLDTVAEAVRKELNLRTPITDLLEQVETETSNTSDIVTVTARDPSPRRAAAIANAFAEQFVAFRRKSERQALVNAANLATTRLEALSEADRQSEEGRQLAARQRELEIAAALQTGGVEVVRRARVPTDPSRPRTKLAAAAGLFLGLILGAAIALVLDFADRRIKDEKTVEELYELPVLASIPPPPRRGQDDHLQREAYGLLAANVRLTAGAHSHVLMVTSPSPADGKTSVAMGLAQALTRLGVRVLVVEADLRRPSIARYTGIDQHGGGLSTLLLGGDRHLAREIVWLDATTARPVTMQDVKDGLSFAVLTAGPVPPNSQRLLARPEMGALVETARSLAEVVIIDTPPIGTVNDAVTLAPLVDSVLVVTRLNKTTKEPARRALRTLRNISASLMGVVVTDAPVVDQYGYYGPDSSTAERAELPIEGARS